MTTPAVNSTPLRPSPADRKRFQQLIENAKEEQKVLGEQMHGYWVGPWEPRKFIDNLMPCDKDHLDEMPTDVKFELPVRTSDKLEKHLYQLFDKTINTYNLSPRFMFFIGADGRAKGGKVDCHNVLYRPDGGVRERLPPRQEHGHNTRGKEQNLKIEHPDPKDFKWEETTQKAFNWHEDGLVIEFKKSSAMDPFFALKDLKDEDRDKDTILIEGANPLLTFMKIDDASERIRGQLSAYATQVFDHQHRTHIFQLLVCGRHARFIFWDHSGAIVSDSFDYTADSRFLVEFFWRYNHMTPEARGVDVTARRASDVEKKLFTERVKHFLKEMHESKRILPRAEQTLDSSFPVYKVTVVDDASSKSEDVLIQAPFVHMHSALGRSTRGYIALVMSDGELKFLKDTWRVEHSRLVPEVSLCRQLEEAEVPCIPKGAFGGDVLQNEERAKTRCQEWANRLKESLNVAIANIRSFRHHKILLELAYPVGSAPHSYEFVYAFRDCIDAIEAALKRCNLLHRDISIGNVMLKRDGSSGVLADWDHAATVIAQEGSSYQNFRTGTWQFISVGLLQNPDQPHTIVDEFESLFWVLFYGALHNYEHKTEKMFNREMFDEYRYADFDGKYVRIGGTAKKEALGEIRKIVQFKCRPLNQLIQAIADEFFQYYTLKLRYEQASVQRPAQEAEAPAEVVSGDEAPNPFSRKPPAESQTPVSATKTDPTAARKEFEECHRKLSNPVFWKDLYGRYLLRPSDWTQNDRLDQDPYEASTTKEKSNMAMRSQLSSCKPESSLGSVDVALDNLARKRSKQDRERAVADHLANMLSDAEDENESCIDVRDHQELIKAMKADSPVPPSEAPSHPPISGPPSPASTVNTDMPPIPMLQTNTHRFPPTSYSMIVGRSTRSSGLKRSIDEVAPGMSTQSIDQDTEGRVLKKSRARAKVRAEPSDRKTRSSSRKTVAPPEEAAKADAKGKRKETRSRAVPQTGDLGSAQPRREGLRPRKAKSAVQ